MNLINFHLMLFFGTFFTFFFVWSLQIQQTWLIWISYHLREPFRQCLRRLPQHGWMCRYKWKRMRRQIKNLVGSWKCKNYLVLYANCTSSSVYLLLCYDSSFSFLFFFDIKVRICCCQRIAWGSAYPS
jgi:hypothetical protein